jgi:hypothetical protein
MSLSPEKIEECLREMGIAFESDGKDFVHATKGNFAPFLHCVVTLDEDGSGITFMTVLPNEIADDHRSLVCELLNLVHGQSLWNVRFHLNEEGRVFSVGKHMLWGKPFNAVQFGDIFFSLLVTTDRLFPCLAAVTEGALTAEAAFERFFEKTPLSE